MIQHIAITTGCVGMAALGQIPLHTLMAQTGPPLGSSEELVWRLGSSLGALVILAWYFYQTQTKTIPAKDLEIAAERAASDVKTRAVVEASAVELRAERESHRLEIEKLVCELRTEREARMEIIRRCGMGPHPGGREPREQ